MSPQILCVIPSRLASQRLPRKPLREIAGKTMIRRVWERAQAVSSFSRVVVATDSEEIMAEVAKWNGEALLTSTELPTGTDRVAAVAQAVKPVSGGWDVVVNLQGDMPLIEPSTIAGAVNLLVDNSSFDMTTLATPILDEAAFLSPTAVKVVVGSNGQALYFSRAPIPHSRDGQRPAYQVNSSQLEVFGLKHIGLYVFRPKTLAAFCGFTASQLERVEMLEQLRALENGFRIGVSVAPISLTQNSVEVDTESDLQVADRIARELGA